MLLKCYDLRYKCIGNIIKLKVNYNYSVMNTQLSRNIINILNVYIKITGVIGTNNAINIFINLKLKN